MTSTTSTTSSTQRPHGDTSADRTTLHADRDTDRRVSNETKPSFKTTELIAYVVAVMGVLVASAVTDTSDFGTQEAWFYVTLLTVGYMVSRGLAKAGSRNFFDADEANSYS